MLSAAPFMDVSFGIIFPNYSTLSSLASFLQQCLIMAAAENALLGSARLLVNFAITFMAVIQKQVVLVVRI